MKQTKKLALALSLSLFGLFACTESKSSADYKIVPQPNELVAKSGKISFAPGSEYQIVVSDTSFNNVAQQLQTLLVEKYKLKPTTGNGLKIQFEQVATVPAEGYQLTVGNDGIKIEASAPNGAFYAFQSLIQMLPTTYSYTKTPEAVLNGVQINDAPRFSYRGTHLDVARHFVTTDSIKRFIDILAMHKINTFHWHLTEDQGWRIEIKKYPKLTEIGSKRARTVSAGGYDNTPHGGYYSQDEVREIVQYAADRYITVIPEIDLPGHMLAALASYPELGCTGKNYKVAETWGVFDDVLCAGNPTMLPFIYDIFDEVLPLFPSKYIHIGGDECPKVRWEKCPKCQAKIRELGLKSDSIHSAEERLQSYITKSVEKYLNDKGKALLGWDEIIEGGLSETATVMAWRGSNYAFEAAESGNDAILSPTTHCYFDYYQSDDTELEPQAIGGCITLERAYSFQPLPESVRPEIAKHILGVQANIWTEYMKTFRQVEYMLLPRLAALSEAGWSNQPKDYDQFLIRVAALAKHYDEKNFNYAKHVFDVHKKLLRDTVNNSQSLELSALDGGVIHYTTDGTVPTEQSPRYTTPVAIDQTMEVKAAAFRDGKPSRVLSQSFAFNKATLKPVQLNTPSHKSFTFDGAIILNDGLIGKENYRSGLWLGFNNQNLSATFDLLEPTSVSEVSFSTCEQTGDWIFGPEAVVVSVSDDGANFREIKRQTFDVSKEHGTKIEKHVVALNQTSARYVRVEVVSLKQMPQWHAGKGKPAFLFVDEISIL
ncbi:MAG: beta-N-acetylhexosaminidase [Bacteroidales bacterium]